MTRTIGDYLLIILSIIGSVISIIAYAQFIGPLLNHQGVMGVLLVGILAFIFLCYNLYLISKYRKRVRYTNIFEDLNIAFAEVHKLDRENPTQIKDVLVSLIGLCDHLSIAFSKVNGQNIGVCIKYLEHKNDLALVTTLVRDTKSKANNRKTGSDDKTEHWLSENSDFNFIYTHFDNDNIDTSSYFEAKLPIREDYKNSRLVNWPPKKMWFGNKIIRRAQWPLKYRSTIVVPIVPLIADGQSKSALRGFLCVDSPIESTFYKEVDVNILRGVCDGVYKKIDIINELINKEHGK